MSSAMSAQRVRLAVMLALVSAAALGSFWVLEVIRQGAGDTRTEIPKDEPDYTVEKFNFVRMSKTGEARYNVSGTRLSHFPNDDSFEIQQPLVHNLADTRAPLTVRADRAVILHTTKAIHLYQNVHADRPASAKGKDFHLTTSYLLLLPDEDIMKTDKPVRIVQGRTTLEGTGMLANNASHDFHLASRAHGVIEPAPH